MDWKIIASLEGVLWRNSSTPRKILKVEQVAHDHAQLVLKTSKKGDFFGQLAAYRYFPPNLVFNQNFPCCKFCPLYIVLSLGRV